MAIEIRKLIPEFAEDYVNFFDKEFLGNLKRGDFSGLYFQFKRSNRLLIGQKRSDIFYDKQ